MSGFIVCGSPLMGCAPGSTPDSCVECGTAVVVAPSGRRRIRDHDLRVVCMDCGQRLIESDPEPDIQPIGADQLAEAMAAAHAENARRRRN